MWWCWISLEFMVREFADAFRDRILRQIEHRPEGFTFENGERFWRDHRRFPKVMIRAYSCVARAQSLCCLLVLS